MNNASTNTFTIYTRSTCMIPWEDSDESEEKTKYSDSDEASKDLEDASSKESDDGGEEQSNKSDKDEDNDNVDEEDDKAKADHENTLESSVPDNLLGPGPEESEYS